MVGLVHSQASGLAPSSSIVSARAIALLACSASYAAIALDVISSTVQRREGNECGWTDLGFLEPAAIACPGCALFDSITALIGAPSF